MVAHSTKEGLVPVTGGHVWYQIVGNGDAIPLLVIHGGPGVPHDYLLPIADLADERPVIFYDQLGCGRSDSPDDDSLWRIERSVEELDQLRRALQLKHVHIFGHSYGSMVATDYALEQSYGIVSLTLASPFSNIPKWVDEILPRLKAKLPADAQRALDKYSDAGSEGFLEYQAAIEEYNRSYICRLEIIPECLQASIAGANWEIRHKMYGLDDFHVTGNLRDYDRTECLGNITLPSLFTCGHYDDITPEYTAWHCSRVPDSELVVFGRSAHVAHLEETEHYLSVLRDFLNRAESKYEI